MPAPRRLSREEKPLYDLGQRLRAAVESTSIQSSDGAKFVTISIGIGHLATRASPEPMTTHDLLDGERVGDRA